SAAYQQTLRYAEDVKRLYQQVHRSIYQSLLGLANALEAKDAYTRGHSERVGAASRRVAVALGLQSQEADIVGQAGLLHDIGKIGVPEAVLRKRVELDDDEWALMRKHPLIGAQIVSPFEFFAVGTLTIRHHHERLDGSRYPDGLAAGHGALLATALAWAGCVPGSGVVAIVLLAAAAAAATLGPAGALAYLAVPLWVAWLARRQRLVALGLAGPVPRRALLAAVV